MLPQSETQIAENTTLTAPNLKGLHAGVHNTVVPSNDKNLPRFATTTRPEARALKLHGYNQIAMQKNRGKWSNKPFS
jgi:hypothetical protein